MRILQLSSARAMGGGEKHLSGLVRELAARGHEVHAALAPHSPLREELRALPEGHLFTVNLRNALDLRGALELARIVRERRIEIVHAHMARDYPPAAFATRRAGPARLIITRHVLFPLNRLHAITLAHAAQIIAVSQAVARHISAQKIVPAHKLKVIPNGVDFKRFNEHAHARHRAEFRSRLKIAPESLVVGTIGELKPQKGHAEFLRAAATVARKFPSAHFIIAGGDTSPQGQHLAALQRLVQELELGPRVHFTGWLEDVFPLLAALDLFVSASQTESFGLAIAEAVASGLAVVSTATEGAREIIEEGAGLLVQLGDVEALARAVVRLLDDEDERERMAARGRESVRRRFSLERMVDETERVYLEALKR